MRWPFVTRATADWLEAGWQRTADLFQAEQRKYADLLHEYTKLRSEPVPSSPEPDRAPSLIDQVIREQAPTDPRLKSYLRTYAARLKREGRSEGDIALALTEWSTTEPLSVD